MKIDIKKALFLKKNKISEIILDKKSLQNFLDTVALCLNNGANGIILTNMNYNDREFLEITHKARQLTSYYEALFIVSSRSDIAYLSSSDGILLDNSSIDKEASLKITGNGILTGSRDNLNADFDFYISENKPESFKDKIVFYKTNKSDYLINYIRVNDENN